MTTSTHLRQLPTLPTLQPGDSHSESLIEAAIQGHADTREAMRWLVRQLVPATQPAEVTDEQIAACVKRASTYGLPFVGLLNPGGTPSDFSKRFTVEILALRPVQVNALAGCNCRWDGDNQVEWCELHLAHKEAIHEWAERAKSAEQKLALRPVQVPMTDEQADALATEAFGEYMCDLNDDVGIAAQQPATGEPVYQIRKAFTQDAEWAWRDATEELFHMHPKEHRRILYIHTAPSVPKDDQIAALVNKVRDIARMFHDHQSLRERIAIELVPALKASQEVKSNAERWRYAIADGGNQSMNFIDIFDDWDGDGSFVEAFDKARLADKKEGSAA